MRVHRLHPGQREGGGAGVQHAAGRRQHLQHCMVMVRASAALHCNGESIFSIVISIGASVLVERLVAGNETNC